MAVLDRNNTIKINNKEYNFCYTLRAIIQLEKRLDSRSILNTLAAPPLSFGDTFEFFHYGLIGGGMKIDEQEAEQLLLDYMDDNNLGDLQALILDTLIKSGAIGKVEKNA